MGEMLGTFLSLPSLAVSRTHSVTPSLPHSLAPSPPHSLTSSLPHSLSLCPTRTPEDADGEMASAILVFLPGIKEITTVQEMLLNSRG